MPTASVGMAPEQTEPNWGSVKGSPITARMSMPVYGTIARQTFRTG